MLQGASHFTANRLSQVNSAGNHYATNVIQGGSHSSSVQINAKNVYHQIGGQSSPDLGVALKDLYSHVAVGALHDSSERCDAPKCHEETRVAVQNDIFGWIRTGTDHRQPKRILWLTGPAGAGKTAIMGSVAEKCQEMGYLAATFFFSSFAGSSDRRDKRRFVSTLAYQLQQHGAFKQNAGQRILSVVKEDPAVFKKRMATQIDDLILKPLRDCQERLLTFVVPMVILVDGLDECDGLVENGVPRTREEEQVEILDNLQRAVGDPSFPFHIIVASRPEPWIRHFFATTGAGNTTEIFLDNKYNPDQDIALFLRSKLSEIRRRYRHLSTAWPGEKVIAKLVENASGQFIYAATVIRFIETPLETPQVQLDIILNLRVKNAAYPLEILDALYTRILLSIAKPDLAFLWLRAHHLITNINQVKGCSPSARFFNDLCESSAGEAQLIFGALPSLIHTPQADHYTYSFYHKSFLDYLEDPHRCQAFSHISADMVHEWILERFARTLLCHGPEARSSFSDMTSSGFIGNFVHLCCSYMSRFNRCLADDESLENCDVDWWLQVSDGTLFPRHIFVMVHKDCRPYRPCRRACKHWRVSIWGRNHLNGRYDIPRSTLGLQLDRFCVKRIAL